MCIDLHVIVCFNDCSKDGCLADNLCTTTSYIFFLQRYMSVVFAAVFANTFFRFEKHVLKVFFSFSLLVSVGIVYKLED